MERDILRRTHNIFSSLKDEIGNKYDNANTNVSFVDENTLKYQNVIKKMDAKRGGGSGSDDSDEDEIKPQADMITANVKHVGKGVIVQSYDISDDEDDGEDDDEDDGEEEKEVTTAVYTAPSVASKNKNKNVEYIAENHIDVDDI
jgi:hypothetical protein